MIASAPMVMGWVPVREAFSWMRACWERAMGGAGWPRVVVAILILVQAMHAFRMHVNTSNGWICSEPPTACISLYANFSPTPTPRTDISTTNRTKRQI